ncbi:MAG TPA: DUF2461 domain-containing protein [bacterium]|nr:DUF2461 domain-containing protein [bacterium]
MNMITEFSGFPDECIMFYKNLAKNNNTSWFKKHKNDYEKYVLEPARSFVSEMGELLLSIAPAINADPRVNRSLFRINRDIRFSKDKRPYKTHLAVWFWEGIGPRMESSGFYFHLDVNKLMIGVGIYCFPKPILDKYREYVVHKKHGPALTKALKEVAANGSYNIGGSHYKRVPRGFDASHKNATLLLHNGLYTGVESDIPDELFSRNLLDYCFVRFNDMLPIHKWLLKLTG